jgi:hypothetical protein
VSWEVFSELIDIKWIAGHKVDLGSRRKIFCGERRDEVAS